MKICFDELSVRTASWVYITYNAKPRSLLALFEEFIVENGFPIVAKHRFGSRGRGNYLLSSQEELVEWLRAHPRLENYIFEKFYNYSREYRLHVTANGCFYTCRKMLRDNTPEDSRWFRNDSNSVWIVEENEAFDKPSNWDDIVSECVKALKAVGLDVGACDVKVQSSTTSKGTKRKNPEFIVIEINSAPSFGERTLQHYLQQIPEILKSKYGSK